MRPRLPKLTSKQRGSVAVIVALLLPVMMALSAFVLDIGTLYAERRSLQNAADSAALAGAREALQLYLGSETADPEAKALEFAQRNGIDREGTPCRSDGLSTLSTNVAGASGQTWRVTTSRKVTLTFGSFVGTPSQCVEAAAEARATSEMLDIMLSLDTTGSMEMSGTDDFDHLREAAVEFINIVNPDPANPRTNKMGMARWAGIKCQNDSGGNYNKNCTDDRTLLTGLTTDKSKLTKLTDGTPSNCSSANQPYACPLRHADYFISSGYPKYTGTKLPNGFFALNNGSSTWSNSNNAWSTTNGGRADAKKIMVLLTDGRNEEYPAGPQTVADWDQSARDMSATFRSQGVEIYVVGFFCAPYGQNQYCTSKLVNSTPNPCPGVWPPKVGVQHSAIDDLLKSLSSSSAGTCDHYYPLKKTDGDELKELFQDLASRLMAVRLTS